MHRLIALLASMLLVLAACGGGSDGDAAEVSTEGGESFESAETTVAEETTTTAAETTTTVEETTTTVEETTTTTVEETTTTAEETAIGDVDAFELSVGDCLRGSSEGEVSGFEGVPCEEEHDSEVYHLFDFADGEFPGNEGFDETSIDECLAAFTTYVGIAYDDSLVYDISWLEPTSQSWSNGDREIVCLLVPWEADTLIGSGRGAAQ